jgi:hypothetical protein
MTAQQLAGRFAATHALLLKVAAACSDEDLFWRPGLTAPPIAFHLWHCGRWADRWAEALGSESQVWIQRGLISEWGFPSTLGSGDTGMELADEETAVLPFPGGDVLTAYLRDASARLDGALQQVDDERLQAVADDLLGEQMPLGEALLRQLAHANRHLGMIEALRGLRGAHGTATI